MLYFNLNQQTSVFVPFKHTMDIYVKTPVGVQWRYSDDVRDEIEPGEFTDEMRRIRDWEWIIKLDDHYEHMTQISCTHRTIHGDQFEIKTKKNYRRQGRFNPHLQMLMNVDNPEQYRDPLNNILSVVRNVNLRHTPEVEVQLNGTICVYTMDRYSFSNKIAQQRV